MIDMAQGLIDQLGKTGARRSPDFLRIDIAHDRVGDFAAPLRRHRPGEIGPISGIRGMLGQEDYCVLRVHISRAEIVHGEAVREVPVAWDAAAIRQHIPIAIHRLCALGAGGPRCVAGVIGNLVKHPLGVVIHVVQEFIRSMGLG